MGVSQPGCKRMRGQAALFLAISVFFFACGYVIAGRISSFYYSRLTAEAGRFARNYATNLTMAIQASDIVNGLLAEKLLAAGEMAASLEDGLDSGALESLAGAMQVDDIFVYNDQGIIEISTNIQYVGWKALPGHPVYTFWKSGEKSYVEDIRKDSESDIYYKYGYFRGNNGRFVQIGVRAQSIHAFLDSFDMQWLIEQIQADPHILGACFLNLDLAPAACAGIGMDTVALSAEARAAIRQDREHGELMGNGNVYQNLVPVHVGSAKVGTLVLHHDTKDTQAMIRNINLIGASAFAVLYFLMVGISILNHKNSNRLAYYAYHHPLTGLPNRRRFQEALLADAARGFRGSRAVLLVSYRNFKQINLLFGYQYGEEVIRGLGEILNRLCAENCHLFHLSADRFAFYITGYQGREALSALCLKIIDALKAALPARPIGGTVGVLEAEYFKNDPDAILKYATLAGAGVRENEPFGFAFYSGGMEARLQREADIEQELREIAAEPCGGGLYLVYQPILHLGVERICGLEALVRLRSKKLGELLPSEFIPIAEKTQLIVPLGRWIIKEACRFYREMKESGFEDIIVSVNISAIQLMRDDFVGDFLSILSQMQVPPTGLGMEITESAFAESVEDINGKLAALKSCGVYIAIDDFGTGYSSLARERDLDVSCLKIDRSFISRISDQHEKALVGDIVSMAHRLGHAVVAEGVETDRQKEYLQKTGCDCMQGYLFSEPLLPADALEFVKRWQARPLSENAGEQPAKGKHKGEDGPAALRM